MTKSKIMGAALMLCMAFSPVTQANTYKWVDEKGETHYGEVIPPEYANKDKVQFDDKGRVVKEKQLDSGNIPLENQSAAQKAAIEQRRKDKALLNTYSNEKEIDLARDRNLQQVEARIQSIKELQKSAQESLDGYRKEARGITAAGKKIPASLQADTSASENRLEKLKQELEAANAKAESVKASFEADKVRYRELIGGIKK